MLTELEMNVKASNHLLDDNEQGVAQLQALAGKDVSMQHETKQVVIHILQQLALHMHAMINATINKIFIFVSNCHPEWSFSYCGYSPSFLYTS